MTDKYLPASQPVVGALTEALTLAREYVESASRRMYDGTGGEGMRAEAKRRLALIDAALSAAHVAPEPAASQPAEAVSEAADLLTKYKKLCIEVSRGDSYHLARIDAAILALAGTPAAQPAEAVSEQAIAALEAAKNGLEWYRDARPMLTDGSDDEMDAQIDAAILALAGTPASQPAEAVSERIRKLVEGLAEQQAMPDDWWKAELAAILALAGTPAPTQAGGEAWKDYAQHLEWCRTCAEDSVGSCHEGTALKQAAEALAAPTQAPEQASPEGAEPARLPESMSRDEMLKYYSEYANMQASEALRYQKRIRDLEAAAVEPATMAAEPVEGAKVPRWLLARATALHEKAGMPWADAEELALSEAGIDGNAVDELIGECGYAGLQSLLTDEDELRQFTRSVIVHATMAAEPVEGAKVTGGMTAWSQLPNALARHSIQELLEIHDECAGDWCSIARRVEEGVLEKSATLSAPAVAEPVEGAEPTDEEIDGVASTVWEDDDDDMRRQEFARAVLALRTASQATQGALTSEGEGALGYLAYQTDDDKPRFFPSMPVLEVGTARWYPPVSRVVPLYADSPATFAKVAAILDGIDRTELDGGWWETSTGATSGAEILARLKQLFKAAEGGAS